MAQNIPELDSVVEVVAIAAGSEGACRAAQQHAQAFKGVADAYRNQLEDSVKALGFKKKDRKKVLDLCSTILAGFDVHADNVISEVEGERGRLAQRVKASKAAVEALRPAVDGGKAGAELALKVKKKLRGML